MELDVSESDVSSRKVGTGACRLYSQQYASFIGVMSTTTVRKHFPMQNVPPNRDSSAKSGSCQTITAVSWGSSHDTGQRASLTYQRVRISPIHPQKPRTNL